MVKLSDAPLKVETSSEPQPTANPFVKLGIDRKPIMLAPLAGVSDSPFRRLCQEEGAALTYVEMLSATALLYNSKRTYDMLSRHPAERLLGVQVTGKTASEVGRATAILDRYSFETIDLNMGCPVTKVTKNGAGSAILKEPERVYATTKSAVEATGKPVSVKIRLGWDKQHVTFKEVGEAAAAGGAAWLTVHGRLRNDDYSEPVDLAKIAELRRILSIPVIGNGNIFGARDGRHMDQVTGVDGLMVSRGALGNPWAFRELQGGDGDPNLDEWLALVLRHLDYQRQEYGDTGTGAVCMRKHLLWYVKGWPHAKKVRAQITAADSIGAAGRVIEEFAELLAGAGITKRLPIGLDIDCRFRWDPKYEMDRRLDRGVGDDRS